MTVLLKSFYNGVRDLPEAIKAELDRDMSSYEEVAGIEPLDKKFESFGFEVIKIDGHDFNQIESALEKAKTVKGKPTAILAKTIKGKGVSFMENQVGWHGTAPNKEQYEQATAELQAEIDRLEGNC